MELNDAQKRLALSLLSTMPEHLRADPEIVEKASGIAGSGLPRLEPNGEKIARFVFASWVNDRVIDQEQITPETTLVQEKCHDQYHQETVRLDNR